MVQLIQGWVMWLRALLCLDAIEHNLGNNAALIEKGPSCLTRLQNIANVFQECTVNVFLMKLSCSRVRLARITMIPGAVVNETWFRQGQAPIDF